MNYEVKYARVDALLEPADEHGARQTTASVRARDAPMSLSSAKRRRLDVLLLAIASKDSDASTVSLKRPFIVVPAQNTSVFNPS